MVQALKLTKLFLLLVSQNKYIGMLVLALAQELHVRL